MRLCLILFMIAGCTSTHESLSPSASEPTVMPAPNPIPNRQPHAYRVGVPPDAPYLLDQISVTYAGMPAVELLKQILPPGQVRFADTLAINGGGPLIQKPPFAQLRVEHLEAICAQANWAWHTTKGVVVIASVETRSFEIGSTPGQSIGRVGGDGLHNDSNNRNRTEVSSNTHASLMSAVESLVGIEAKSQARVSLAPEANLLLVTATPDVMSRVESFMKEFNGRMNRRISIEYVLYEVDVTETENRGIDVQALRNAALSGGYNFLGSSFTPGTSGELSLTFEEGNSFDGSSVILGWLRGIGNAEMAMRKKVIAQNNQVTALRDMDTVRYVGRVALDRQISGSTESNSPNVDIEELNTGESWAVLPTIVDDRVYLRLALTRANLTGFDEYDFANGEVSGRLPQSNEKDLTLPISLIDGETRIITNLSSTQTRTSENGMPLTSWLPFMKSRNHSERRIESVVAITARIL